MTRLLLLMLGGMLSGLLIGYCAHADWFTGTHVSASTGEHAPLGPPYVIDMSNAALRVAPDQPTLGRLIVIMSQMIQQAECRQEPDYIGDPPTRQILPYTFCNCTCPAPGLIHIGFCGRQTSEGCQCP